MTNTSPADVALINSLAVQCGCGSMHWDAYGTGRCAREGMVMDSKYIAALETECEQANTLIGLLRHAAAAAKHPWYSYTYPPYVAYREARAARLVAMLQESGWTLEDRVDYVPPPNLAERLAAAPPSGGPPDTPEATE